MGIQKTAYIEQLYRALFLAMIDLSLSLIEGKPGKLLDLDCPSNQTDYKKLIVSTLFIMSYKLTFQN